MAREKLEQEEGVFQVYFTGCAGNVAAGKYNDGTPEARDQLMQRLYAGMKGAVASTRYEPPSPLVWRTAPLVLTPKTTGDRSPDALRKAMADPKLPSIRRSRAARLLAFYQAAAEPIELCSLQMGRMHIVHLPGEPAIEFQLYAQQQLPEDFVAVAGYGDGGPSYICTDESYGQGGYEPGASAVELGSEARLKAAIRQLLGLPPKGD